jgi:hypothetical protein
MAEMETESRILRIAEKVRKRLTKPFTIMVIPHSESRIFTFQITPFTVVFVSFTLLIFFVGFLLLAGYFPVQRAFYIVGSHSLEMRIEAAKEYLTALEKEKSELNSILTADRQTVSRIYENEIRSLNSLVLTNFWLNFAGSFVAGVLSTIAVSALTFWIRRKRKLRKKEAEAGEGKPIAG